MEILKYLKQFLIQSYWYDENTPEQAKALFTTYCLMENIDADTEKCDNTLIYLYDMADIKTLDISLEEFKNYMLEYIV